jgi:hypothetical protein
VLRSGGDLARVVLALAVNRDDEAIPTIQDGRLVRGGRRAA